MYGVTEIEGIHMVDHEYAPHASLEEIRSDELRNYMKIRCQLNYNECWARTLEEYNRIEPNSRKEGNFDEFAADRSSIARDKLLDILSDSRFVAPMVRTADLHSTFNKQSYFYVFGYVPKSVMFIVSKNVKAAVWTW